MPNQALEKPRSRWPKEQPLGFQIVHVCIIEVGYSVPGRLLPEVRAKLLDVD